MGNLWTKTIPISSRFLGTSIISSLLRVKYSREQFIIIIIIWNGYYWMGHAVLLGDFVSIQSCWRNLVYDGVFFGSYSGLSYFIIVSISGKQITETKTPSHVRTFLQLVPVLASLQAVSQYLLPSSPLCIHAFIHSVYSFILYKETIMCHTLGNLLRIQGWRRWI